MQMLCPTAETRRHGGFDRPGPTVVMVVAPTTDLQHRGHGISLELAPGIPEDLIHSTPRCEYHWMPAT